MPDGKGRAGKPRLPAPGEHPHLSSDHYEARLRPLQYRMRDLALAYFRQRRAAIVVFEGGDAAGKGGAIRRLTAELDPRQYDVWPIGRPGVPDLARPYLWRFWERMPAKGEIGIFDRSWYGRVLVERVEGLTPKSDWRRAYGEINRFESDLVAAGVRLVKLYLHVSEDEQADRLRKRMETPYKRWKLEPADFEAYTRRADYDAAAAEMFHRTSTDDAPWTVVAADDKKHARIAVLETVIDALSAGVDLVPPALDPELERLGNEALGGGS